MAIHVVQLGSARLPGEGLRLGTVRRPPRGVPKSEYARRNFYDLWLPDLAPSAETVAEFQRSDRGETAWRKLERRYRSEMKQPGNDRLLALLAALSHSTNFSVGCYCDDERRCHRSILQSILRSHGAKLA